jgi:amino acid adenylation domain-containing protein
MDKHILVQDFLEHSAERVPGKVALVHQGRRLTYQELDSLASRLASGFVDLGVRRGDRVAVFMDNSVEAVVSLFAALKAGAVFLMINHTTKKDKLEYILNDCGAKVLLAQDARSPLIHGLVCPALQSVIMTAPVANGSGSLDFDELVAGGSRRTPSLRSIDLDLASIMYTSGSTGRPKGVMLSHLNMVSAARSITTYLENNEYDVIMNMLPLSFDYGLYQILMGFMIRGTVILEKSFAYPYQVLDLMVKEEVTGFPGVPTIFAILLRLKDIGSVDLHALRYITNTAAALPKSHIAKLRSIFPGVRIYSMYGLTECKRVSYLPPEELDRRPSSVGRGMPNEEVFIVNEQGERARAGEVGELVVRGANVMLGYWNLPEETARCLRPGPYPGERMFYTGDLFTMDDEGYLYFVARKDDIIKSGGEKVSPKEIENVLYSHEAVVEAAVVGIPDEVLGQAVKAYVVTDHGRAVTEKEILKYCADRLESFMVPKQVEFRDTLPKTATGKIDKKELKTGAVSKHEEPLKAGREQRAIL